MKVSENSNLYSSRLRWPSVLDFPGQSLFLTSSPGKNQRSPGTPICPVFGLASRICPNKLLRCSELNSCCLVSFDHTHSSPWSLHLQRLDKQDIPCANVFKMVEFCLSLPGTNAANESFLADEWLSDKWKNAMSMDTVKSILIYYSNKFWCFLSRLPHIAGNASTVAQSIPARSTSLNRLYKVRRITW